MEYITIILILITIISNSYLLMRLSHLKRIVELKSDYIKEQITIESKLTNELIKIAHDYNSEVTVLQCSSLDEIHRKLDNRPMKERELMRYEA